MSEDIPWAEHCKWKWKSLSVSDSLWPHGLYSPWTSPGQDTGAGSLSLLHGIFPTQESNRGLLHCRQILYQLSHKGSPRILEQVAHPFSSGSSQPRNWTQVSHIASEFFTSWATREALIRGSCGHYKQRNFWSMVSSNCGCRAWCFLSLLPHHKLRTAFRALASEPLWLPCLSGRACPTARRSYQSRGVVSKQTLGAGGGCWGGRMGPWWVYYSFMGGEVSKSGDKEERLSESPAGRWLMRRDGLWDLARIL